MFYALIRGLLRSFLIILGLKVEGLHNLPPKGPVIVAANHVSNWDPILVGVAINRPVHFMAKAELFHNPLLGTILRGLNAFPVNRGSADRNAIRQALELLEKGETLGIFPQGGRRQDTAESSIQPGVGMLAMKSRAAVVPVAVIGTKGGFPLGWIKPLRVIIGKPLDLSTYYQEKYSSRLLGTVSQEIMAQINLLLCK
ncbi:MAG: 1-acyl-sn-glycerol-3-phosphate acyltransferase [Syntrophomonadaceae bacterium]|mgnify:FL=1|jgi:1-acyl-sn-glycerol-3-phosphate acyltransferase|nr:1-acyl-sn-glycerol-3-phosphate acyltransferase [Syntrophomonadaceae bacterium]